ncbi:MAG: thioredoxin-like domain-containing protein [Bacteroidales bacterium]
MKKIFILLFCLTAISFSLKSQNVENKQNDKIGRTVKVDSLSTGDINTILKTFDGQTVSYIIPKIDFLISTGKTNDQKSFIASRTFLYYYQSKIMGYEEAAIYVVDNYFLNGKLSWPNESSLMQIKMFADFNRHSLIGMQAPELVLYDRYSKKINLQDSIAKYKIIYFYDNQCPTCEKETPQIMNYLQTFDKARILLYRVFTQKDNKAWILYVDKLNKKYKMPINIDVADVWDEKLESDFPRMYGVVSTPKILLLDKDNKIIGRNLHYKSLTQLIKVYEEQPDSYAMFFDKIFKRMLSKDYKQPSDTALMHKTIKTFYQDNKYSPEVYQLVFYNLYQYLKGSDYYELQKLAAWTAKKYIIEQPELWKTVTFTSYDNLENPCLIGDFSSFKDFMSRTKIAVELFNRNPLEEKAINLSLYDIHNDKHKLLENATKYTVLYFYSLDCAVCDAVDADMKNIYSEFMIDKDTDTTDNNIAVKQKYNHDISFVTVCTSRSKRDFKKHINSNKFYKEYPNNWISLYDKKQNSGMFEKYDLSVVPAIYLLNKNKEVIGKELNPATLEEILKILLQPLSNQ